MNKGDDLNRIIGSTPKVTEGYAIERRVPLKLRSDYVGKRRAPRGHTWYELDLRTGNVAPAAIEDSPVIDKTGKVANKKYQIRRGYIIEPALNLKNAHRRFANIILKYAND